MSFSILNPLYPRPHIAIGGAVASGVTLSITSTSAATSFTSTQFDPNCPLVVWDIQGAGICVTEDGATPSAATNKGHQLAAGTNYTWSLAALLAAKFTLQSAGSAAIYVSQWAS